MVVLSELNNMFWGLTLESGKRYEQTTERGFHISMACLEPASSLPNETITVALEQSKKAFILCCLQPTNILQQPLDLNFAEGEEICFYITGKGKVHLTGYMHLGDENFDETLGESDEEDEEEEVSTDQESDVKVKKRKQPHNEDKKNKKRKISNSDTSTSYIDNEAEEASHDEDDDDDDDDVDIDIDSDDENDEDIDDDDDDDYDDSDQMEDSKIHDKSKSKSHSSAKLNKKIKDKSQVETPKQPTKGMETQKTPPSESSKKKKKKKNKNKENGNNASLSNKTASDTSLNESKDNKSKKNTVRTVDGGITVEDIKEGSGAEAKLGKTVQVFYTGKLNNGKIFDQKISGNPFKFRLGKKEVIAGWDSGLKGMKVGGKRKLVIPPKFGYGNQTAGSIPPNSTLTFEVELKNVS